MTGASLRDRASRAAHGAAARLRHPATIACAYIAIAIFTFGYSGNHQYCERQGRPVSCTTMSVAVFAFFGGALWPLYWSWELQQ